MVTALVALGSVLAGDPAAGPRLGGAEGPDLTRYLVVCALLVVGVAGLGWGLRRVVGRTLRGRAARRSLQVLDVLPLGGKQRLTVVRCYDRSFLLGLGEREVTLVAELDAAVAPEGEPLPEPLPERADRMAFAALLRRSPPSRPAAPAPARSGEPPPSRARRLDAEGVLG